jgi:hypothetical protein
MPLKFFTGVFGRRHNRARFLTFNKHSGNPDTNPSFSQERTLIPDGQKKLANLRNQ